LLCSAIRTAAHHTGTTVTSAGLILAATFGAAGVTGATSQIKQLGAAIALGVLIDTFLVRTLMVPAIVVLCRRYNWWPSPLARRGAEITAGAGGQPAAAVKG
jgi:putative drug exporter of the RND superfamily